MIKLFSFLANRGTNVPKSFWLNLQANYDAELMEYNEEHTVTDEEFTARDALKDIVKELRDKGKIPVRETKKESIISLRRALQISNIANLKNIAPAGAFRLANNTVNQYVLGAWVRMCQIAADDRFVETQFEKDNIGMLTSELKSVMLVGQHDIYEVIETLKEVFGKYGIDFSVVKNFRGAPVQGYISQKKDGSYQMVLTIRGAFADIFWFSLFHEIGHIINGDIGRSLKFLDDGSDKEKEDAADLFAADQLIDSVEYKEFIKSCNFDIDSIKQFSKQQNVKPYVVIGRLQKEQILDYRFYSEYKLRYKW